MFYRVTAGMVYKNPDFSQFFLQLAVNADQLKINTIVPIFLQDRKE